MGGMRNPADAVKQIPNMRNTGIDIANLMEEYLDAHPEFEESLMSSVGVPKGKSQVQMIKKILECRVVVARYLDADLNSDTVITEVSQSIMEMWAKRAGDPDILVVRWLREGAPAGITKHPENVGGS